MFFIYEHWRPDTGKCFYVGKGKLYNGKPYRAYSMRKGRNRHHQAIVNKLLIRDLVVDVKIIFETNDENEAFAKEIERIAFWRDAGVALANVADGGGINSGWILSEQRRKQIGEAKKGNKYRLGAVLSDETKKKISNAHIGKTYSDEYKAAMAIACAGKKNGFYGKTHNEKTRAAVAASNRRRAELRRQNATRST